MDYRLWQRKGSGGQPTAKARRGLLRRAVGLVLGLLAIAGAVVAWHFWRAQAHTYDCTAGRRTLAEPAATLWYIRPSVAVHRGRLYAGFVGGRAPFGDTSGLRGLPWIGPRADDWLTGLAPAAAQVASWTADGRRQGITTLTDWESPDDHGAPAILSTPSGLVAAFSHHSSPLYVMHGGPDWSPRVLVDEGEATYPRLLQLAGSVVLVYARTKPGEGGGRDLVYRVSNDDGATWSPMQVLVRAEPGWYIYATQAVARGGGFCIAGARFGAAAPGVETNVGLFALCRETDGRTESWPILEGGHTQDLLPFDIAIADGRPRVAFAACPTAFDPERLWPDCPAHVAEWQEAGSWRLHTIGQMASQRMPGGMSFDPADPDRIALVERVGRDARIVVKRLDRVLRTEQSIATAAFPAMPVFTGTARPSLVWSEIEWYDSTTRHDMRLAGRCDAAVS